MLAPAGHVRDAVLVVERGTDLGRQLTEPIGGGQLPQRVRVAFAHPFQGALAGDVLQPQVRVLVVGHPAILGDTVG